MARQLSDQEKLRLLEHSGLKVDQAGDISDWLDRPPTDPRPLGQGERPSGLDRDGTRVLRRQFTQQEDEILRQWCLAAEVEGVSGTRIFGELETVCPSHTWQAHQNRWRKSVRPTSTLSAIPTDGAFPGLDSTLSESESLRDEGEGVQGATDELLRGADIQESDSVTYNDHRIDIDRVLFSKLDVCDEGEFCQLLRQPWLLDVYRIFCNRAKARPLVEAENGTLERSTTGISQHRWKLDRANFLLARPEIPSRYAAEEPNTSGWSEDDFDIHFMVRTALLASAGGAVWYQRSRREYKDVCEKALWLLLWFKWLHKTTRGMSKEMQRLQRKRERWLVLLTQLKAGSDSEQRTVEEGRPPRQARTNDTNRQLHLVSDEARNLYLRCRNQRLASWGVGPRHIGTCVLVPATWASTAPDKMADALETWPQTEFDTPRLCLAMGAFRFAWARAAAWFETWPRTTVDLQHFLPPSSIRLHASAMHGSHLCHHGLCILPSHIEYESNATNLSRKSCATAAINLRAYGAQVPKHCHKHQPPCLMQAAALTTFEVLSMQFEILRLARDLPARAPIPRPAFHPPTFESFEQGVRGSDKFPDVGIDPSDVVRLCSGPEGLREHRFRWSCSFCNYPRVFERLTTFWAHLRVDHTGHSRPVVLREVTKSARANQAWADQHFYDYKHSNPNTWQKIVQAQSSDFTWEVFDTWRLPKVRLYAGRATVAPADDVDDVAT